MGLARRIRPERLSLSSTRSGPRPRHGAARPTPRVRAAPLHPRDGAIGAQRPCHPLGSGVEAEPHGHRRRLWLSASQRRPICCVVVERRARARHRWEPAPRRSTHLCHSVAATVLDGGVTVLEFASDAEQRQGRYGCGYRHPLHSGAHMRPFCRSLDRRDGGLPPASKAVLTPSCQPPKRLAAKSEAEPHSRRRLPRTGGGRAGWHPVRSDASSPVGWCSPPRVGGAGAPATDARGLLH